jgi:hypothetical protein
MIGIEALVGIAGKVLDRVIPDEKQKAEAQMKLAELAQNGQLAELAADGKEQDNLTARMQADMASDSWLSKNIRPMTLVFILLTYTVFGLMSAWDIEVNNNYVELLGQWGMLIMSFYFGGRTLEKIMKK